MINRNMFMAVLDQIEQDEKNADRLTTIFRDMTNDFIDGFCFVNPKLTALCVQMLDKEFGEDCDWVSWWVYEYSCGDYKNSWCPDVDNGTIVLDSGEIMFVDTKENLWESLCRIFNHPSD